jgi:predicted phosphohydrolase
MVVLMGNVQRALADINLILYLPVKCVFQRGNQGYPAKTASAQSLQTVSYNVIAQCPNAHLLGGYVMI